jgi:hypothetical protein
VDSFVRGSGAEWRRGHSANREKNGFAGYFTGAPLACRVQLPNSETRNTQKGEATMLKNILVVLGIAAITSSSAFAASKTQMAPKTSPAAHKVAQASETKPAPAKADKKMKKATKATTPAAATEKAPAAEKAPTAPAPAEKTPAAAAKK